MPLCKNIKIPYWKRNRWWPPTFRSSRRQKIPPLSLTTSSFTRRAETASGSPKKKRREWTEWQGRRPWRCNVQMCVKNKTSSARENAFRPASSINDSSFPTGILNNLPPPFFPSFLPPFPNASIRSDGSSTNQPTICSSGMIGIGDQRKQEEGEEEISRLVGALEARLEEIKEGRDRWLAGSPIAVQIIRILYDFRSRILRCRSAWR